MSGFALVSARLSVAVKCPENTIGVHISCLAHERNAFTDYFKRDTHIASCSIHLVTRAMPEREKKHTNSPLSKQNRKLIPTSLASVESLLFKRAVSRSKTCKRGPNTLITFGVALIGIKVAGWLFVVLWGGRWCRCR